MSQNPLKSCPWATFPRKVDIKIEFFKKLFAYRLLFKACFFEKKIMSHFCPKSCPWATFLGNQTKKRGKLR